jgi:hypothetical protein
LDEKAIKTCFEYQKLVEQAALGGYCSEDVKRISEVIKSLDHESKLDIYRSAFDEAYETARELCSNSLSGDSLNGWRFDLTAHNLGVVCINYGPHNKQEFSKDVLDSTGLKMVSVDVESFRQNMGSPQTSLSLYKSEAYDSEDNSYQDIDQQLLRVLDALETLHVVKEHI